MIPWPTSLQRLGSPPMFCVFFFFFKKKRILFCFGVITCILYSCILMLLMVFSCFFGSAKSGVAFDIFYTLSGQKVKEGIFWPPVNTRKTLQNKQKP